MFSSPGNRVVQVLRGVLGQVTRNYVRRITPLSIVPRAGSREKYDPDEDPYSSAKNMDPEIFQRIQSLDDTDLEPDLEQFHKAYGAHQREQEENWKKVGRSRMVRKHFKSTVESELCVLTYAEKEKIRFLHKSDPQEWNIETLAQAFPISETGVFKLLKSSFRCKFPEDIARHDQLLATKLKLIQAGKINLTPELQEKMVLRNSMPPNFGATSIPELGALIPAPKPKKLGEFARLVAKPSSGQDSDPDEPDNTLYLRRGKMDKKDRAPPPPLPPLENYDSRLIHDGNETFKLGTNERMTLTDFESTIKSMDAKSGIEMDEEDEKQIRYLLNYNKKIPEPDMQQRDFVDAELESTSNRSPTTQEYVDFGQIVKFKRDLEKNQNQRVEVTVDKGRPYIYNPEHGYQKPYSSEAAPNRIKLPANAKKEGSVYRVGDSYYDDHGEFLYRVI